MKPLPLLALLLSPSIAQILQHQLTPSEDGLPSIADGSRTWDMDSEVKQALALLVTVKAPAVSRFTRITNRPKGFVAHAVHYAQKAFFLLFMNGNPEPTSLLTAPVPGAKPSPPLAKAVRLLDSAAARNDPDALLLLAEMNLYGNFTHPVNYANAIRYYHLLASETGNSTAQHMLGFLYSTGLAAPEYPADQAKSMLYHTFAAEQGNTRSEMTLAYRFHAGVATPKDCEAAVQYYQRVADKAIKYYRSGPPGGHSLVKDGKRLADDEGGVYGEGASVSSAGLNAKHGSPTSDMYADVDDVLEFLHLQSSQGDLKSSFTLARLYYDGGRGVTPDMRQAKQYFLQIAREYWLEGGTIKKDVPASTERLAAKAAGYLGRMFLRGEGMEQSFSKAKIWFTRGIGLGDPLSQYGLGLMHLDGLGLAQDVKKASEYFGAAADHDLAVAQTNLGILFLDQGDVRTALAYFELAIRNGHIEAFYYMAEMTNLGIGRDRSCGEAALYYKLVVEKAEAVWAPFKEANAAYEKGEDRKALLLYMMAAEQGSESGQANVAWLLDRTVQNSASVASAATALVYWTRSAMQNNLDSLVKMGDYYLAGLGVAASPENAAACYQTAADSLSCAQAMWNLGWMHENGIGLRQDFHLAKRYYDLALQTNAEAYLPVKLGLWKLRWRSWWNDVTDGGVKSIGDDEDNHKRRSLREWVHDFVTQARLELEDPDEGPDWESDDFHAASDGMWGDDNDDDEGGDLEKLLILALAAALLVLLIYRALTRRRDGEEGENRGVFPAREDLGFNDWVAGGIGH